MNDAGADPLGLRRARMSDLVAIRALQHAAYAPNRAILGVEPLPLLADYAEVLREHEVWLAQDDDDDAHGLAGVLILERRRDDLLIWSIATQPGLQQRGLGRQLLEAAEARAAECGLCTVRLYTGQLLTHNVAWYSRHGYRVERVEDRSDRVVVHLFKTLA